MLIRSFASAVALFLMGTTLSAQRVMTLPDARQMGYTVVQLDSLYMSAFNVQDTTLTAFPGRTDEFISTWYVTLGKLKSILADRNVQFAQGTTMTYRSFFNTDGRLEHFH